MSAIRRVRASSAPTRGGCATTAEGREGLVSQVKTRSLAALRFERLNFLAPDKISIQPIACLALCHTDNP